MAAFDTLIELFRTFPGIGPRQAKRFAYYLIHTKHSFNKDLASAIEQIKKETKECTSCHRFFSTAGTLCSICSNVTRDTSLLMIIAYDSDLESIEKSNTYKGTYFVFGGLMSLVEKENHIREAELISHIRSKLNTNTNSLSEIIIAMSVTAEGDHTVEHIQKILKPLTEGKKVNITTLGRGVSTGSELEYADGETIKNALQNRH